MQDLGGQVHREVAEGGEGEVSPVLPSPGPRRAAACWQWRERSGRGRRLGACLICGIPQIIRAAGNVGQDWRIPSPASAPGAAGGRKGSGGKPGGFAAAGRPACCPGPTPLRHQALVGFLSTVPPAPALALLLSGPEMLRGGCSRQLPASPRLWDLSLLPGVTHVRFPSFTQAFSGFLVPRGHPMGVCVFVPSLHLLQFLQPLRQLREGEEAELPAGSLAAAGAAGAAGEAAISLPGAGFSGSTVLFGFFFLPLDS